MGGGLRGRLDGRKSEHMATKRDSPRNLREDKAQRAGGALHKRIARKSWPGEDVHKNPEPGNGFSMAAAPQ